MKKKNILLIALVCILTINMTGCVSKIKQMTEDGEQIRKEYKSLEDGFWVKNRNNSFSPLCTLFEGYKGYSESTDPRRYIWFTNNNNKVTDIIPVLYPGQEIIIKSKNTKNIPEKLSLEKYKNVGYTIGVHFEVGENGTLLMSHKDPCKTSVGGRMITSASKQGVDEKVKIVEFNNMSYLPTKSVNKSLRMLLGLDKMGIYQVGFYLGTNYTSLELPADTIVFQSSEVIDITSDVYSKTKDGFFSVSLPKDLKEGYYMLNGIGLFYNMTSEKFDEIIREGEKADETSVEKKETN